MLLTDLSFLQAQVDAGLVFDLAGDLNEVCRSVPRNRPRSRTLRLLAEAVSANKRFVARRPGALLAYLWQRCWWYDCPDAARYYTPPAGGAPERLPWQQSGPKLCDLLESWPRASAANLLQVVKARRGPARSLRMSGMGSVLR
jgi:hypothetical protein